MQLDYSVTFDKPCADRHGEHIKVHVNGAYAGRIAVKNNIATFRGPNMLFSVRVMKARFPVPFENLEAVMHDSDAVRTIAASAIRNV